MVGAIGALFNSNGLAAPCLSSHGWPWSSATLLGTFQRLSGLVLRRKQA